MVPGLTLHLTSPSLACMRVSSDTPLQATKMFRIEFVCLSLLSTQVLGGV